MKLTWEYLDDTFSLIEDEKSKSGYSVICTSDRPSKFHKDALESFSMRLSFALAESGHPSLPDFWDNMHGYLSEQEGVKILEAEPIEYPEGAVF